MTDQEMRIAIAEACGWHQVRDESGYFNVSPLLKRYPTEPGGCDGMPDYPNDLNAMHEAEITLSLDQRDAYWNWLARITEKGRMATAAWLTITATARQRSEAFLRTAGKWKETP